ncbi:pilus assembly protein [Thiohalocapsa sp. ML1]|uniref:pilus assembly protein n=1 Tax=Thiohalocapsa sp. ML1 TaxID=1431688 RepID=UPI000731FF90|nr:PilC/PilY family type IV pilus protein [Thiohalocapsa sp. ML1]
MKATRPYGKDSRIMQPSGIGARCPRLLVAGLLSMTTLMAVAPLSLMASDAAGDWPDGLPDAIPPFLSEGVAPNLVLTIDTSTSMRNGYTPDGLPSPPGAPSQAGRRDWSTSSTVNKLYFDPDLAAKGGYQPAKRYDGSEMDPPPFGEAPLDPFADPLDPDSCTETVDLDEDYEPVWTAAESGCAIADKGPKPPEYTGRAFYHEYNADKGYKLIPTAGPNDDPYEACILGTEGCRRCGDKYGEAGEKADGTTPDECFQYEPVDSSQEQQFANWYSYYRTRLLAMKTVLSRVMQTLDGGVRLTYQGLDRDEGGGSADLGLEPTDPRFQELVAAFDKFESNKEGFYDWLFDLAARDKTYLVRAQIRAGEFVSQGVSLADEIAEHKSAFGGNLSGASAPSAGNACGVRCRNNFHLVLSDGFWEDVWGKRVEPNLYDPSLPPLADYTVLPKTNIDDGTWIEDNQDGSTHILPSGPFGDIEYSPLDPKARLYADENIGTLADAVFYYWRRDLDGDPDNNEVPVILTEREEDADKYDEANFWNPKNDPATWQHLTFFAVGLGLDGAVTEADPADGYGTYQQNGKKTLSEHGFPSCLSDPPYAQDAEYPALNACTAVNNGESDWIAKWMPIAFKLDDLYHAGLNGRGGYFDASDPEQLYQSFAAILDTISATDQNVASNAPVAVSSGQLSNHTRIYQVVTHLDDWSGTLRAFRVSRGYGIADSDDDEDDCADKPRGVICEDTDAPYQTTDNEGSFAAPELRLIFTMAGSSPKHLDGDTFKDLSAVQRRGLIEGETTQDGGCSDLPDADDVQACEEALAKARIDWLRGDDTPTIEAGVVPHPPTFRDRGEGTERRVLGDILGSAPVVVGPPRQRFPDDDGEKYSAFKTNKADRKTMVYVGANDGMLHGFDAKSLVEKFAYVPGAVYHGLADLTDPAYGDGVPSKRAFVDGGISYSDAKLADGKWHSVLVGALGLGAQGVYALDVTNPESEKPEDIVLWEFTDASGSDDDNGKLDGRDMGFNAAPPAIVRIDTDPDDDNKDALVWVALVSNGYENTNTSELDEDNGACTDDEDAETNCTVSQTGNAVLYVLNLAGPDDKRILARMDTGHGMAQDPTGNGRTNGLAEVATLDEDGDLIADRAYAGDLFGNLWRFDLRNIGTKPILMFQARDANGDPQPITTRIAFARHPNGGHMLLFGTGRLMDTDDKIDVQTQTFYGIWDDNGRVYEWTGGSFPVPTRLNLMQHAFIEEVPVNEGDGGQSLSLGRTSTSSKDAIMPDGDVRGWMIDLEIPGEFVADCGGSERVVSNPELRTGRIRFVSVIPEGACGAGGSSWINALDAISGSRLDYSPFDFDLSGTIDKHDLLPTSDGDQVGSSIRLMADDGTGIYSMPSDISLGGGRVMSIISDSKGDLSQTMGSGSMGRTWLQR